MSSNHFLKLQGFEGPLDLLLYLVKAHEMDIFQVDVFALTLQYLEFLRMMEFKDLAEASTFLEMASNLCEIKSRSLLPNEQKLNSEEDEDSEKDPEMSLQNRLLIYDTFKKAGEYLMNKPTLGVQIQGSKEHLRLAEEFKDSLAPLKGQSSTLLILYEQMFKTLNDRKPVTVKTLTDSITLDEVIEKIQNYILNLQHIMFQELYAKFNSRYEMVAYILAFLQLVRDGKLNLYQETFFGPIWLYDKNIENISQEVTLAN